MNILDSFKTIAQSKLQEFDPNNPDHVEVYRMLRYEGKQHPEYRFKVKDPFLDVASMMTFMMAEEHLRRIKREAE